MTTREEATPINFVPLKEGKQIFENGGPTVQFRNCSSCVHFKECFIWRMIADTTKGINAQLDTAAAKKIEPMEIATICPHYTGLGETIGR